MGALVFLPGASEADLMVTFGSGGNQFTMDFVEVTGGTEADTTGAPNPAGAVANDYIIGKHEVSRGMIEDYNALSGGPAITMANMTIYTGNGSDRPATGVSWNEAARFVN